VAAGRDVKVASPLVTVIPVRQFSICTLMSAYVVVLGIQPLPLFELCGNNQMPFGFACVG
jgi:hypothetical protein